MTSAAVQTAAASMFAASLGLLAAARWIQASAAANGLQASADRVSPAVVAVVFAAVMLALGLFLIRRLYRLPLDTVSTAAIAGVSALGGYTLLHILHGAVAPISSSSQVSPWPFAPALAVGCAALIWRRPAAAALAISLLIAGFPQSHSLDYLSGDYLARRAACYSPPPALSYLVHIAAPLSLVGSIASMTAAFLTGTSYRAALLRGLLVSIGLAVVLSAAHIAAFFATMATGQSFAGACAGLLVPIVSLTAASVTAAAAWRRPGSSWILRLCPLIVALFLGAFVFAAAHGASAYRFLNRYHADIAYTYVHFTSDGAWRRSLDHDGSTARLQHCQQFLDAYPYSAYRPAVLLMLAQCQFELWDFRGAVATLDHLAHDYPRMQGYPSILRALAAFAEGRPDAILAPAPADSFLAEWRRTQGALLAATAAERLGLPYRALGFHAAYENYIRAQQASIWASPSLSYSDSRSDDIVDALKAGLPINRKGTVMLRLLAGSQPIAGARVVLVQPHYDAALPADSRQFTGAWTIAAWNGSWGISNRDGRVRIENVPYGIYELVLGLPLHTSRRGFVVSSAVPPVTVNRPEVTLPPIRLVPAVKLISPRPGALVGARPELRWEPYPGAAHYSVSVLALNRQGGSAHNAQDPTRATTCWARSMITEPRTRIDAAHFTNGWTQLRPGTECMWLVYAYAEDGRLIASSEHYHDLMEPTFTVGSVNFAGAQSVPSGNCGALSPASTQPSKGGTLQ